VFLEKFHGLLARCQNAQLNHHEGFWSAEATSVVRLVKPEDVLDKMIYTFANPAAADLVDSISDWPAAHSYEATLTGGAIQATRPKHFFRSEENMGKMPESITLNLVRPIGFEAMAQPDWADMVKDKLREVELGHRDRRRSEGKNVLGRRRVENQSPFACPKTCDSRFNLSPRIAAKSKWARIEAIQRDMDFVQRHAQAVRDTLPKVQNVVFPFGTYLWRKLRNCVCEPDPRSSLGPPSDPTFA
jgi:putative transposase